MKTATELQSEINTILKGFTGEDYYTAEKREINKADRRVKYLKTCLYYLETNPSEKFLLEQLAQLKKSVERIKLPENFEAWKTQEMISDTSLTMPELLTRYKKEMGLKDLETQIKSLQYLLS